MGVENGNSFDPNTGLDKAEELRLALLAKYEEYLISINCPEEELTTIVSEILDRDPYEAINFCNSILHPIDEVIESSHKGSGNNIASNDKTKRREEGLRNMDPTQKWLYEHRSGVSRGRHEHKKKGKIRR